jgi:hypothetical protein
MPVLSTLIMYLSYLLYAVYPVNNLTITYIWFCIYMVGIESKDQLHDLLKFESEYLVYSLGIKYSYCNLYT